MGSRVWILILWTHLTAALSVMYHHHRSTSIHFLLFHSGMQLLIGWLVSLGSLLSAHWVLKSERTQYPRCHHHQQQHWHHRKHGLIGFKGRSWESYWTLCPTIAVTSTCGFRSVSFWQNWWSSWNPYHHLKQHHSYHFRNLKQEWKSMLTIMFGLTLRLEGVPLTIGSARCDVSMKLYL